MSPTKEELQLLLSYGWSLHPTMIDVFVKDYETAVGTKTAMIVIYKKVTGEGFFTADYESEGRNILQAVTYYTGKFELYLKGIDHRVDRSYARSLYLNHGVTND